MCHFSNDSAHEADRGVRIFRDSLMALLITEFVMGTENKVPASNPDGEHVISECWLKHRLGDIVI